MSPKKRATREDIIDIGWEDLNEENDCPCDICEHVNDDVCPHGQCEDFSAWESV